MSRESSPRAHIFDVDHTLTRRSTGFLFARAARRDGIVTWRQLASLPYYYLRYRLGRLSLGAVTREIKPLQGYTRTELYEIACKAWEEDGRDDVYRSALAYLQACRAEGAPIILATSSFDVIVAPLQESLGIEYVISSVMEFDDEDRSTGWLVGGPCYAEAKAGRMLDLLKQLDIDPQDCAFYSDSIHDLPGLRSVGKPVAVNPDLRLKHVANRAGWPILRWGRENR